MKSLQKEQNSTNLLPWPTICRNKHAKWPPSDLTPWTLTLLRQYENIVECAKTQIIVSLNKIFSNLCFFHCISVTKNKIPNTKCLTNISLKRASIKPSRSHAWKEFLFFSSSRRSPTFFSRKPEIQTFGGLPAGTYLKVLSLCFDFCCCLNLKKTGLFSIQVAKTTKRR